MYAFKWSGYCGAAAYISDATSGYFTFTHAANDAKQFSTIEEALAWLQRQAKVFVGDERPVTLVRLVEKKPTRVEYTAEEID